jgi:DNA-binding phage protein
VVVASACRVVPYAQAALAPDCIVGIAAGEALGDRRLQALDLRLVMSERAGVERAGGQAQWAKRVGVNREALNKMLALTRPLTKRVIKALKLRIIYAPD